MPTVTPLYVATLALIMLVLGIRVVVLRGKTGVGIGHGESHDLRRAIRVHGNFIEWVPLICVLLVLLELQGLGATWLHVLGGTLVIARCLHAFGLSKSPGISPGRAIGASVTFLILGASALLLLFPLSG